MNISKTLGSSYQVAKNNPMIIAPMLVASVFGVVFSLIVVGSAVPTIAGIGSDPSTITSEQAIAGIGAAVGGGFLVMIISGFVGLIAHGMTVAMANMALNGETPTLATGWARFMTRLVPVIIASILMGLIIGLGTILLVLPGIVAAFLLVFTIVAVVVDDLGAGQALSRSLTTVTRNFGATFVFFLVVLGLAIIAAIASAIVGAIPLLGAILTMIVSAAFSGFLTIFTLATYRELSADADA
ncbi:MAG: hypothetical protein EA382_14450, partial [Spirochaetaceae bacterium]